MSRLLALTCLALVAGCPGSSGVDGGGVDGASHGGPCATDTDCDDGLYCTGTERCAPTDPRADVRGCVSDGPACSSSETCDEVSRACVTPYAEGDPCAQDGYFVCLAETHQCCGGRWIVYYDGPCWAPDAGGVGPDCTAGLPQAGCPCTDEGTLAPCAGVDPRVMCHAGTWTTVPGYACCS